MAASGWWGGCGLGEMEPTQIYALGGYSADTRKPGSGENKRWMSGLKKGQEMRLLWGPADLQGLGLGFSVLPYCFMKCLKNRGPHPVTSYRAIS